MTTGPEEKEEAFCSLCGRLFFVDKLAWSTRQQSFVCLDCLLENESCGCEDD